MCIIKNHTLFFTVGAAYYSEAPALDIDVKACKVFTVGSTPENVFYVEYDFVGTKRNYSKKRDDSFS